MNRTDELNDQINELRASLDSVEGTPTEVYTRIVGYYRSLKNWNRGKREEYTHRVTFGADLPQTEEEAAAAAFSATPLGRGAEMSADGARATGGGAVATIEVALEATPVAKRVASQSAASYLYFYRESCPNCPPMRAHLETIALDGEHVDVDTDRGVELAMQHEVLATPTVVLLDEYGRPLAYAHDAAEIERALADE